MIASIRTFDRGDLSFPFEPGLPYFLDGIDTDSDDLADWWLDLGSVDLNGVTGV
jgi:hypothetical protein